MGVSGKKMPFGSLDTLKILLVLTPGLQTEQDKLNQPGNESKATQRHTETQSWKVRQEKKNQGCEREIGDQRNNKRGDNKRVQADGTDKVKVGIVATKDW